MKQENKQHVKKITIYPEAVCFCPLGLDWYTNSFEVVIHPDRWFPDYIDVRKFVEKEIAGKPLIIEDACKKLRDFIESEYEPKDVTVISRVSDVTSHDPVEVEV